MASHRIGKRGEGEGQAGCRPQGEELEPLKPRAQGARCGKAAQIPESLDNHAKGHSSDSYGISGSNKIAAHAAILLKK